MKNRIADILPNAATQPGNPTDDDEQSNKVTEVALRQLNVVRKSAEQFVESHPAICLGAAFVTGIAIGWWVKRK